MVGEGVPTGARQLSTAACWPALNHALDVKGAATSAHLRGRGSSCVIYKALRRIVPVDVAPGVPLTAIWMSRDVGECHATCKLRAITPLQVHNTELFGLYYALYPLLV